MKIPFLLLPQQTIKYLAKSFYGVAELIKPFFPFLELNLKQSKSELNAIQYLAMCIVSSLIFLILFFTLIILALTLIEIENSLIIALIISPPLSLFIFIRQILYPKLEASRKIRDLEVNLLPSLRATLIHLSSGIPLYEIIVSISNSPYGELSNEYKSIIKKINSGKPIVDTIEESAANNPSPYYRRALWQLSNGMKAGGEVTSILKEIIDSLSKEQTIQIENYGSQLNPLAMFYMLIAVVIPSLAITLLVVISAFVNASGFTMKLLFLGLYILILFFQILFLGLLKTRRPTLISS